MEIRRRCETCNVRLQVGLEELDRITCYCERCGKVYTFYNREKTVTHIELNNLSYKPTDPNRGCKV